MAEDCHRHDINDEIWVLLEPASTRQKWDARRQRALRQFPYQRCVLWILHTGAPWRDLPPDYGSRNNFNKRFRRWHDMAVWGKLLEALINSPDYELLMIDASHIKGHPHASGAAGGNLGYGARKG